MTDYLHWQFGLPNRRALVTGASRGIGRAIALGLAGAGAEVCVHYYQSAAEAAGVVGEIEKAGGRAWAAGGDLADGDAVRALMKAVEARWGGLDILVNNAGDMMRRSLLAEADDQLIEGLIRVNLLSAVYVTRAAIPLLGRGASPSIINTASIAAHNGGAGGVSVYAAAKGAIVSLTRSLAKELAPTIRVNAIAPGVIITDLHRKLSTPQALAAVAQNTALKRNGEPEECAGAAVFLASAAASFITGEIIEINGGLWFS